MKLLKSVHKLVMFDVSHASPVFITPSPHIPGDCPVHKLVLNKQLLVQLNVPPVKSLISEHVNPVRFPSSQFSVAKSTIPSPQVLVNEQNVVLIWQLLHVRNPPANVSKSVHSNPVKSVPSQVSPS